MDLPQRPKYLAYQCLLKGLYFLRKHQVRATYRDEARHGKAFAGLLARYFGK
jgi:hypothetical protein